MQARWEALPHTKKISFFDSKVVQNLAGKKCILVDLTRLSASQPAGETHFESEFRTAGGRIGNVKELVEIALTRKTSIKKTSEKTVDEISKHITKTKRGGSGTVVMVYGFHADLPHLIHGLTERNVDHLIVLSKPQVDRLLQGKSGELNPAAFRITLAQNVARVRNAE